MKRLGLSHCIALALATMALGGASAAAPAVRLAADAALRLGSDASSFGFVLYRSFPDSYVEPVNENATAVAADLGLPYRLVRSGKPIAGGRSTLRASGDACAYANDLTAHRELKGDEPGYIWRLAVADFAGAAWKADGGGGTLPAQAGHSCVGKGETRSFTVTAKALGAWTVTFEKPCRYQVQDRRTSQEGTFEIRFAQKEKFSLARGEGGRVRCTVRAAAGKPVLSPRPFETVAENADWIALDWMKVVKAGSVIDFSRQSDRPLAKGSAGALEARDGALRFAKQPDRDVRLFGATIQYDAAFASDKIAQELFTRLQRLGYNAIRLTHVDRRLLGKDAVPAVAKEDAAALDAFVTAAERRGFVVYREFWDERSCFTWEQLGERRPKDADERPDSRTVNALYLLNEPAFAVWQAAAKAGLGRKCTKSTRTCLEDPGQAIVATDVCCGLFHAWGDLRRLPSVTAAYDAWLKAKRTKEPDFMAGNVCETSDLGVVSIWSGRGASIRAFLAEAEAAGTRRQGAFLKSLKSKALFATHPAMNEFRETAAVRASAADMMMTHFSIDPPRFLGERWTLPVRIANVNPFAYPSPIPAKLAWLADPKRPFGIAGWSQPPPSSWRAGMGLYLGARAVRDGWDAVWRDAYASDPAAIADGKGRSLDLQYMNDPVALANECAIFTLFARGDFPTNAPPAALSVKDGGFTVATDRTAGGFTPDARGRIAAGPLEAELSGAPAAVWVSSVTDKPVLRSNRLLLFHVTEMQRSGVAFADSSRTVLVRRGTGPVVVRNGTAKISIATESARGCIVNALRSDGSFLRRVDASVKDGRLVFTASVAGPKGASVLYEIVRK